MSNGNHKPFSSDQQTTASGIVICGVITAVAAIAMLGIVGWHTATLRTGTFCTVARADVIEKECKARFGELVERLGNRVSALEGKKDRSSEFRQLQLEVVDLKRCVEKVSDKSIRVSQDVEDLKGSVAKLKQPTQVLLGPDDEKRFAALEDKLRELAAQLDSIKKHPCKCCR